MAVTHRSKPIFLTLVLLLQFCFSFLPRALAISTSPGIGDGYTINGRVKIANIGAIGFGLPAKISNAKVILNGGQKVTFLRPDGYFSLVLDTGPKLSLFSMTHGRDGDRPSSKL